MLKKFSKLSGGSINFPLTEPKVFQTLFELEIRLLYHTGCSKSADRKIEMHLKLKYKSKKCVCAFRGGVTDGDTTHGCVKMLRRGKGGEIRRQWRQMEAVRTDARRFQKKIGWPRYAGQVKTEISHRLYWIFAIFKKEYSPPSYIRTSVRYTCYKQTWRSFQRVSGVCEVPNFV